MPLIAKTNATMISYLLFSIIFFLLPCSFVAAELSSTFSKPGGIYHRIKTAFGPRAGVLAVWLQWMQNIIWVPTVLAFAADSFAYSINLPHLAYNPIYTDLMIIFMYWCAIVITLRGLNLSSIITAIGAIFGVLIPSLVVIYLGIKWIISGQPINISITPTNFFPDFSKLDNISFAAGIVLLFGGMEVNAVHVNELRKPTTQYLKSLIISVIIILIIFFLGSISLAVIVPQDSISIMQALHLALKMYNLEWLVNVLGICIALGVVCCIIPWICGPSKGMLVAAQDGVIPRILAYKNKHGIQRNILIIQGILVALFSLLVILMKCIFYLQKWLLHYI